MGLLNDMVSNLKKVVMTDEEGFLNEEDGYLDTEEKKNVFSPFAKKSSKESKPSFPNFSNQNYNLNSFDYNQAKSSNQIKKEKMGHIQVFVPKNFDEAFDVIKSIMDGTTAMVNVETTSAQNAIRIIDAISGAMFALNGQSKKIGEKQYIFTLNAELTGAIDYLPNHNQNYGYRDNQYQNFDMQNPFSFGGNMNQNQQSYGNYQTPQQQYQQPYQQQGGYNTPYQNQQNSSNYNNQSFDFVKPQNQF